MSSPQPTKSLPVLILDKAGILGETLARVFIAKNVPVCLVSGKKGTVLPGSHVVAWKTHVPRIPQARFSQIFAFQQGERDMIPLLPALERIAQKQQCSFYFVSPIRLYNEKTILSYEKKFPTLQYIFIGDIYSKSTLFSNTVSQLLFHATVSGEILLYGNGLSMVYPMEITETMEYLYRYATSRLQKKQTFLFAKPLTLLSVARMLLSIDPSLRLAFSKKKNIHYNLVLPSLTSIVPETHNPVSAFRSVYMNTHITQKMHTAKQESLSKTILLSFCMAFFGLLLVPFFLSGVFAGVGSGLLLWARHDIANGSYERAGQLAGTARSAFHVSDSLFSVSLGKRIPPGVLYSEMLRDGEVLSELVGDGVGAFTGYIQVLSGESEDPYKQLLISNAKAKQAIVAFQFFKTQNGYLAQGVKKQFPAETDRWANLIENLFDVSPKLLGFEREQTYLLLFQNSNELRPGGGFIGSVGVLQVKNGAMSSFKLHDVYDLDGQLKGHIEPPMPLKKYLGVSHWFLRDSNFDVDFTKNAYTAAFFYNLETGKTVDGVIGITSGFLESILSATGPVYLPAYKETLSSDNVIALTQERVQTNFFPGSTQKRDYLQSVFASLTAKMHEDKTSYKKFIPVIEQAFQKKQIMFGFSDNAIQDIFITNGLSSSLKNEKTGEGIHDFFGISEANIGENKVNSYIKREIVHTVSQKDTYLEESVSITYTNTATSESPFAGDYKQYLRLITPNTTQLAEVMIDGEQQASISATQESNGEAIVDTLTTTEQDGKSLHGIYLSVPQGGKKQIVFSYRLPTTQIRGGNNEYTLFLFSQPGMTRSTYTLHFIPDSRSRVVSANKPIKNVTSGIVFQSAFDQDEDVHLSIVDK